MSNAAKTVRWNPELEAIAQMLVEGLDAKEIGEHYGVSKQRIYQVLQKWGLRTPQRLRATFLDGKPPKYYWLNRMLSTKKVPRAERMQILENLEIPDYCPVFGIELNYDGCSGETGFHGRKENSPSLDQIYPGKGYTLDNLQIISWRANRIKNDATPEELLQLAEYMRQYSKDADIFDHAERETF